MTERKRAYNREYSKLYHAKHREKRNINAKAKRLSNKLKCIEYLGGQCFDCKETFNPVIYDFHHLDPSQKDRPVGSLLNWNWGRQKEELDKCVLLCANCHRLRHWRLDNGFQE